MQIRIDPLSTDTTPVEQTAVKGHRTDRVREHLANERTYLDWMRSAISLIGFGLVIVRIRMFQPPLVPSTGVTWKLGLAFSIIGLLTVLLSTQHYYGVRRAIDAETYESGDRWVALFSMAVLFLGTGIIYYVFTAPMLITGAMFE